MGTSVQQPSDDPTTQALADALPGLRAVQNRGWMMIALIAAGVVLGLVVVNATVPTKLGWWLGIPMLGGFAAWGVVAQVKQQHEAAVMPIVARAFGLLHSKGNLDYFNAMPQVFIPRGNRRNVDDMIEGKIADRQFRFAEVRTTTGGKNPRTLFRGIVMDVPCRSDLPEFLIVAEKQTKGFLWAKGAVPVEGMTRSYQARSAQDEVYGLWSRSIATRDLAGMQAFLDRMLRAGEKVGGTATLYSMVCRGGHFFVALSLSGELFTVGGLLATEAQVMADVRSAAEQLAYPVNLVAEILRAEDALLSPPVGA